MLKFGIIFGLLASIIWRTTPTNCRQTSSTTTSNIHFAQHGHNNNNVNNIIATNIQNYMDLTAKPCENFYQYACGNWYQQHIDNLDFGDTLSLLDYELDKKLEHLLKKISGLGNETGDEQRQTIDLYRKVRTYYKSCKKVKPYNFKKYLQLIQPGLETGWFILSRNGGTKNWQPDKFDWLEAIAKLRLYGLNGVLLKEEVLPRWDDSSTNSIYLDKPNLAETQPMEEGVTIELLLDIGQTKRIANQIAREVHTFEMQLHRLHEIEDEEGPKEMQLSYLQEYMPQIEWLEYLKQLNGPTTSTDTTVIIQNIPYMRALVKLLNTVNRETLCNYIMLKFLLFLRLKGPAEISKHECIASLRRAMPLAMSYIIGKHFYKDQKQNDEIIAQIFEQLKNKFRDILTANRLQLEQPVVKILLDKIDKMTLQIGYTPRNATIEQLDEYYERIALDVNSFYINQLSFLRLAVERSHESLDITNSLNITNTANDSYILNDWLGSSSSPFYVKPKNKIILPYGFLQMPVYHRNFKNLFKYSVLGFVLAHEILHGFDSTGIEYDSVGNIMGPNEEITANQRFMHGLRCIQTELPTGGHHKLNEKLADYEGFRLTYETFFENNRTKYDFNVTATTAIKTLSHLSTKQLFLINFAQFFCGKVHRGFQQSAYLDHAMDELRVLQTLANFEEFSRAFGCERKTKMLSKHRCKLW